MWSPDPVQYKHFQIHAEAVHSANALRGFRVELTNMALSETDPKFKTSTFIETGDAELVVGWQHAIQHGRDIADGIATRA